MHYVISVLNQREKGCVNPHRAEEVPTYRATFVGYTIHGPGGCVSLSVSVVKSRPVETDSASSFTVVCPLDGGNNYWVLHSPSPQSRDVPGKRQRCSNETFPLEICPCWDLVRHVLPAVWSALKWRFGRCSFGNSIWRGTHSNI